MILIRSYRLLLSNFTQIYELNNFINIQKKNHDQIPVTLLCLRRDPQAMYILKYRPFAIQIAVCIDNRNKLCAQLFGTFFLFINIRCALYIQIKSRYIQSVINCISMIAHNIQRANEFTHIRDT